MAKKHLNKKLVSGLMAAMMLSSTVPLSALAADSTIDYTITELYTAPVSTRAAGTSLDFSYAGASAVRSVDISEIIRMATGESISSQEAAYLASEGITMRYDETLSSSLVSVSVSGESSITFTAGVNSYQAYNGANVRWIPVSVTIDGKTENFVSSPKGYTASFSGLTKDTVYTATFTYQTTITVSSYALTSVVNYAYNNAQSAIAAEAQYEQAKIEYDNALIAYQEALKGYETQYAEYQKHQDVLATYNAALAAYNAYIKKVTAYEESMKIYNNYLSDLATYDERYAAYEAEVAALPEKQAQYEKYLEYLAAVQSATNQLAVLDSCFIADSAGRTMYATLMGDTVDAVLANRDELVNYGGVSVHDINNAGDATTSLRGLLQSYRACSSADAKLTWYQTNYSSLKSNFISLYSSLENLGKNRAVAIYLSNNGKFERYCQFVCQLYVISTGLDDSTTFNVGYTYNGHALVDLIESCQLINDTNSYAPGAVTLPEKMDPVEKPVVPIAPKKPTAVSEPVKTWTEDLEHPGEAPTSITMPKKPVLSDFTTGAPQMPQISTQLRAVVDLVRSGALTHRTGSVQDVSLTRTATFSTTTSISSMPVVTFYDYDGKTVLYTAQVERGGNAVYAGATPTRESDVQYSYVFSGWTDANGNPAGMSGITANTQFYAKYTQKLNEYTITWDVAGERVKQTYKYGETPVYQGKLSYHDGVYQYVFTGWSPSISKVTGDAEYVAQYTMSKLENLTYGVTFEVRSKTYYRTYKYGEMPVFNEFETDYVAGGYRYVFTGWSPELEAVTDDAKYVANFEKMFLIPAGENGEKSADMTVTQTTHTVTTDECMVNASYAVKEALAAGTQLVLELGGATVTFDNDTLQQLSDAVFFRLMPSSASRTRSALLSAPAWELAITNAKGEPIAFDSEILLELPIAKDAQNGGRLNAYVNDTAVAMSLQDEVAYLRVSETGLITFRPYYSIEVMTDGNGGDVVLQNETAEAGATVALSTYLEQGWTLGNLFVSINGGAEEVLELTDGAFTMPEGDVSIRAEFVEATYTVVFMANGVEVSRATYRYGDVVAEPDMTNYLIITEGEVSYTFAGWDTAITSVKGDAVYTAQYTEENVGENPYQSPYNSDKLFTIVLPIVGAVLTLGLAAFLFYYIRKKKYGKGWKDLGEDVSRLMGKLKPKFSKALGAVKGALILCKDKTVAFFRALVEKIKPNDKK